MHSGATARPTGSSADLLWSARSGGARARSLSSFGESALKASTESPNAKSPVQHRCDRRHARRNTKYNQPVKCEVPLAWETGKPALRVGGTTSIFYTRKLYVCVAGPGISTPRRGHFDAPARYKEKGMPVEGKARTAEPFVLVSQVDVIHCDLSQTRACGCIFP